MSGMDCKKRAVDTRRSSMRSYVLLTIAVVIVGCAANREQRPGCPAHDVLEDRIEATRWMLQSILDADGEIADAAVARRREQQLVPAVRHALELLEEKGEGIADRPFPIAPRIIRRGSPDSLWPNDTLVIFVLDLCFRTKGFILENPDVDYREEFEVFHWPGDAWRDAAMLDQHAELLYKGANQTASQQGSRAGHVAIEVPPEVFLEGDPQVRVFTSDGYVSDPVEVWVSESSLSPLRLYELGEGANNSESDE